MAFRTLLEGGKIIDFPMLQLALAAAKDRVNRLVVHSRGFGGGEEEDEPLLEITGPSTRFRVRVLNEDREYLDWLNGALLCSGLVEPAGLTSLAHRLADFEDVILAVDTNVLYSCILGEHLLDEFARIHVRPYRESLNWILLIIPGVVMKEVENAANQKRGGHLTHVGRRGYRALQEIMMLNRTEGFQGLSVLVAGPTNPPQLRLSSDGITILNADSMIRDQVKAFLRGIEFRKGVFFLTMDKTNASLAAAEGLPALRIPHPRRLRKGEQISMPKEDSILLARVLYEIAVEFGIVRVSWNDGQERFLEFDGGWSWKSMEHWEAWQLLCTDHDPGLHKALSRYVDGRFDAKRILREWSKLTQELSE